MNAFTVGLFKVAKVFLKPFFPRKVYGPTKFEKKRTIIVGNHISGWDSVLFYMSTKNHVHFVYKAEFEKSKFLHSVFDGAGFIPIRRGEADISGTKRCLEVLKKNRILALFPEGTRNPNVDCLQQFKTGAALFAIKTKTPIRPFYIWDKAKAFHKSYIIIGQEFELSQFYNKPATKEVLEEATAIVRGKVDALRIELNEILAKKGVKRRKRTAKELQKIAQYKEKLAKQQIESDQQDN